MLALARPMSAQDRVRSISILTCLATLTLAYGASAQAPTSTASTADLKKLSVEELMNLEVTSVSRRPQKLSETASAIQVITGDDIRRAGATSVPEALRLAANLEVAHIDSRQWAITARGFNNTLANKMLVLIDGRTVYTPLYAGVYWDVQDTLLEDIDRIEVISGPGATQWGANAVNGVINITTKSAKDTQGGLLTVRAGTELSGFGGLRYGGEFSGLHYRVYGKYFDRDRSVLAATGQDFIDGWHVGQGGFRLDWDSNSSDRLTLQGDIYDGASERTTMSTDVEMSGGNLLGRWSRTLAENSDLQLQVYYDRTHRRLPTSLAQDLDTYDLDFQHRFPLGASQDVVWGLSYRLVDDRIDNPATFAFLPASVTHDWFGGFAQDEITLVPDRLHLTLGTKLEHNDYTGLEVQPSIRAAWQPDSEQTVWSAVSRAVRTPSRIDRDFFAPASPPFTRLQGGPDFISEKLLSYELGYRVQPRPQLVLSLATFYNDYDDLRSVEPVNPPAAFPIMLANGLTGKSYGAELTADYRASDTWRLQAGYTELRAHSEPKAGSLDRTSRRSVALDPKRQALLRSSLDLPGRVECDATLRYVGRIENQDVPAYTEFDLRLGWRPGPAWELSLVGQNLLHDRHAEFGAAASRREIERSFYGTIVWGF
jgi:iron complex outermembrane recepter protein